MCALSVVGDVVISPGFNSSDLYLAASSIGGIYAYGVSAEHVRAVASG